MDKILLYVNANKDEKLKYTSEVADTLDSFGYEIFVMISDDSSFIEYNKKYKLLTTKEEIIENGIELAVCLGGDGTILGFVRKFYTIDISVIGLNIGTLGFLAELSLENYERLFREFKEGRSNYKIQERSGLYVEFEGKETRKFLALNDVVIARGARSKIIDVEVYINGIYVDVFQSDGIMISTATGSTGYNLSAGGPILLPSSTDVVLTPICPHSLRARPIVVTKDDIVTLKLVTKVDENSINKPTITIDGQIVFDADTEASINVKGKEGRMRFFTFDEEIFFRKLRDKIR